jgi:serine protease Do
VPPDEQWRFRAEPLGPFVVPPFDEMVPPELWEQMPGRERGPRRPHAASGCILDPNGHVLTVYHAVDGAEGIAVTLHNGRRLQAELVGADEESDLAVLRIEADDLPVVQFGDSEALRVGQAVFAVGNPPRLPGSVAAGVVSGLHRSGLGVAAYEQFIQTDIGVGAGFAGGPLADLHGRVVGITVSAWGEPEAGRRWTFAIPVSTVEGVLDDLLAGRQVQRGWLGVAISEVSPQMAEEFGYAREGGALIQDVMQAGPADSAGLEAGDIIAAYRGRPVQGAHDLRGRVAATPPGTEVTLTVWRDDEEVELSVELGSREGRAAPEDADRLGLQVQELAPEIAEHLGRPELAGVLVADVDPDGPAAERIRPGDVILSVNREEVASVEDYRSLVEEARGEKPILLRILDGETGNARFVLLPTG